MKISNLKIYECCLYKPVEMTLKYMPYFVDEETGSQSRITFSSRSRVGPEAELELGLEPRSAFPCTVWILQALWVVRFPNGWEELPENGLPGRSWPSLTPPRLLKARCFLWESEWGLLGRSHCCSAARSPLLWAAAVLGLSRAGPFRDSLEPTPSST